MRLRGYLYFLRGLFKVCSELSAATKGIKNTGQIVQRFLICSSIRAGECTYAMVSKSTIRPRI